jgi:hypothetical protein
MFVDAANVRNDDGASCRWAKLLKGFGSVDRERRRRRGWSNPARREEWARAAERAAAVKRERADRFAANVLPVVHAVQAAGISTLDGIAAALNARGVRTARGRAWYAGTVRNILARQAQNDGTEALGRAV